MRRVLFIISAFLMLTPSMAGAGGFSISSISGFAQANYSLAADASNPDNGDMKWAEEIVELQLDEGLERLRVFLKADASLDHIDDKGGIEIREAFVNLTREYWDMRIGRQIITWGVGDLVFINDVFPKDYEAFFSGRPLEYLKKGVDAIKAGAYPGFASFELVIMPFFEPDNLPDPGRFWMFDPMPDITRRIEDEPASGLKNTELALRAYRGIYGFDASLYAYKGFYRTPSMLPFGVGSDAGITLTYPELSVYGASLQGNGLGGVLSVEAGYYDSTEDSNGDDPFIPNTSTRLLLGYQRQIIEDMTMTIQYYGEYMRDYDEYKEGLTDGSPAYPRLRDLASLRMTYLLMHQDLRLSWFSFRSLSDGDYLLNPEARYNFSDNLWAAVGANIFGGEAGTQFGSLDENDCVYMQARYGF